MLRPAFQMIHPPANASVLAWDSRPADGYGFSWHLHPETEVVFFPHDQRLAGSIGRQYVGDSVGPFGPGSLVLLGPGLPHAWVSRIRGPVRAICVQFREAAVRVAVPEAAGVRALLDRATRGLTFDVPPHEVADRLISLPHATPMARWATLMDVLDRLARLPSRPLVGDGYARRRGKSAAADGHRVGPVLAVCADRIDSGEPPPDVDEAASLVGLSPSAFGRLFRRATGRAYVAQLHELRIGRACRLLIETDEPITRVALACGFGGTAQFNRLFRRLRDTTPRAYRRLYRPAMP